MIYGDPYKFAIIAQAIKGSDKDNPLHPNILFFCLDEGYIFPKKIINVTLQKELSLLWKKSNHLIVDHDLFNMPKEKAFTTMYKITFLENWNSNNNYGFDISPEAFANEHCYFFTVSNGENVRIIASQLEYDMEELRYKLDNISVCETTISIFEFQEIVYKLKTYVDNDTIM